MNIYHKLDPNIKDIVDEHLWVKHRETIKSDLLRGLHRFFYVNQYDEERFPHFMLCEQFDEEGDFCYMFAPPPEEPCYVFYEKTKLVQNYSKYAWKEYQDFDNI